MIVLEFEKVKMALDELELDFDFNELLNSDFKRGALYALKSVHRYLSDIPSYSMSSCSFSKDPDVISCDVCGFHFPSKYSSDMNFCPSCGRCITSWRLDYPF